MSDELMELPEGWATSPISESCLVMSGQTPKGIEDIALEDEEIPWFRVGSMNEPGNEEFLEKTNIRLSREATKKLGLHIYPAGTIVFPKRGGAIATNKKRILAQPSAYDLNLMGILPIGLENRFVWHWFQTIDLKQLSDGSNVPQINHGDIEPLIIPVPPLKEQRRIVAKIEELRERSQKARSHLSAIPNLCDKFRQSVLAAAFRGDLTADWREQNPDVETASVLLERISRDGQQRSIRKKTNLGELDLSTLPEIPETWKWEQLIKISGLLGGVTKGRKFNGQVTVQVPYLRVANVQDGFLDLEEIKEIEVLPEDINKYRLEHGDILFTEGGDRDKLGRGTVWRNEIAGCIHQNHVYRSRLYSSEMLPEYVSLAAKSKYAKDYFFHNASQTVNLASINMTTLGKLPLPIPPTDEQKEICSIVYKLFEIAEIIKTNHSKLFHQLDQLDRSILAKAFRGELVEQEPNDEPASVLLDRIRAEREQQAQGKAKKPGKKGQRTIKTDPP